MAALEHGSRKFYDIPSDELSKVRRHYKIKGTETVKELFDYVESNCIGKNVTFSGPYGLRKAIYCDYTASGRSLAFIEDYIRAQVLPHYGNTHTTTNVTSLQSTLYRHEARGIIRNAVNASESDSVVFVGSGVTGAVHKLIHVLDLKDPPTVFVGPFEHHSNLLPWKEQGAKVVWIKQDCNGLVDLVDLESKLKFYSSRRMNQLIGCFSAASNITGILTDVDAVTACLHRHGALALWDYATAGPYVEINMNPVVTNDNQGLVYKDAVFISTHKFVGGVSTSGVLIAKKKLFINPVPSGCGGGSVFFVTHNTHRYLKEIEMREEAGTPAIVESIRAGLVFQLKQEIGSAAIMTREEELCGKALNSWRSSDNLILLGNTQVPRLPIFSFLVRHPQSGVFLHHNYVCALLNDLFGIQARGGCACAGPYAQDLLGINESLAKEIEDLLLEDSRLDRVHLRRYHEYSEREILRPGFVRLNLPYFMSDDAVDFVIKAVELIAQHGWKLLPQYMFNPETGEWRHRKNQIFRDRKWLGSISYSEGHMTYPSSPVIGEDPPSTYEECLNKAQEIFELGSSNKLVNRVSDQRLVLGEKAERLRWFLLPSEASDLLSEKIMEHFPKTAPFIPPQWKERNVVSTGKSLQGAEFVDHYQDSHGGARGKCSLKKDLNSLDCSTEPSTRPIEQGTSFPRSCPHCVLRSTSASLIGEKDVDDRIIGVEKCDKCKEKDCFVCLRVYSDPETQNPTHITNLLGRDVSVLCSSSSAVETESLKYNECHANICKNGEIPSDVQNTRECSGHEDKESCDGKSSNFSCDSNGWLNSAGERFVTEADNCRKLLAIQTEVVVDTKKLSVESRGVSDVQTNGIDVETEKSLALKEDGEIQTNGVTVENDQSLNANGGDESQPSVIATIPGCSNPETLCKRKSGKNKKGEGASTGKPQFQNPPKSIFKATVQALEEYEMIRDGDRVMVCLSGGKDSLSLLHTLHQYQFYAKSKGVTFDLGAATVDPQSSGYDPRPLIGYLAALEVPYFFEQQGIIKQAAQLPVCESICSFCSRMKRGRLYACARREGYNVLAMGQHLDDLAESFMMSVFHNGLLRTMKANYTVREGDLRVIRPFVYVRERDLRSFAENVKLPVIAENCPACFEAPKERHRTKQLLAAQEILFPALYQSLLTAMKPLMARDRVGLESSRMKVGDYDEFL